MKLSTCLFNVSVILRHTYGFRYHSSLPKFNIISRKEGLLGCLSLAASPEVRSHSAGRKTNSSASFDEAGAELILMGGLNLVLLEMFCYD